jgi:hypothetical protein
VLKVGLRYRAAWLLTLATKRGSDRRVATDDQLGHPKTPERNRILHLIEAEGQAWPPDSDRSNK